MTLKEKQVTRTNNANYLMMTVQSKDQTGMKRIFDRYQRMAKMTFVRHTGLYRIGWQGL